MNYIYDVIADFSDVPYEFYEWNKSDYITHLKKVLIVKVSTDVLNDLVYNKVKISNKFLSNIKNKTEFYSKIESDYIVIFTDSLFNICIKFNKSGINQYKSYLQLEEDEDVLDISKKLSDVSFDYQIISDGFKENFKTRKEKNMSNIILKNIEKMYNNNEVIKLKYIYYDCFGINEEDKNIIYDKLYKEICENNSIIIKQIYDFFKLISVKID